MRFKSQKIYSDVKLAKHIEKYINNLYGIKSSKVTARTGSILVFYHMDKTNLQLLKENIENALVAKKTYDYKSMKEFDNYNAAIVKKNLAKRKFVLWCALYLLFKMKSVTVGKFSISRNLNVLKVASAVTIIAGYPLIKKCFNKLTKYIPLDSDKLLEFTALSFTIIRESSKGLLLLILKSLDDYIKYYSEVESRKSLLDSYQNNVNMAWIKTSDGSEVLVSSDSLEIGNHCYVYPGEIIPTYGIIEEGNAIINSIYCTGQPLMSHVKKGYEVNEGFAIVSGSIKVKVMKILDKTEKPDTTFENLSIYKRVKNVQDKMTILAASAAALSYLFTKNILIVFSVMLVLSPKATSVALNSGIKNYLSLLGKNKIYLQNTNTFEYTRNVNKVIFDKTGTLTSGEMRIISVSSIDNQYSNYDIQQIFSAWKNENKVKTAENRSVLIGNEYIMQKNKIDLSMYLENIDYSKNNDLYPIFVAVRKKLIGIMLFKDNLREGSKELIDRLKFIGINNVSMLTGDTEVRAQEMASALGILNVYSNMSNHEKAQVVETEKNNGTVMMVGDGINDILAMRTAHVSVCFANNSYDIVKPHSDCIIYDNNILKLSDLISLSQKSYSAINRTMLISNIFNLFLGMIAFGGGLNIFAAKSLNTINSILVLLINKRILLIKSDDNYDLSGKINRQDDSFGIRRTSILPECYEQNHEILESDSPS